jgi:predicted aconitase with swiveling domain
MALIRGTPVIAGAAHGIALVANQPLSFWGGYDHTNGEIIDRRHPLSGQIAAGAILCVPFSRGSSTTTAVLLEAIRAQTAPAAIISTRNDFFFALAAVVADELFALALPIISITEAEFSELRSGMTLSIARDGLISGADANGET